MSDIGPLSRRQIIRMGGLAVGAGLAGCMDTDSEDVAGAPAPIALTGNKQCDVCGMVIGNHPGPNAQIFYREHEPEEHPNPAWFDSLKACMFPYYFEHERLDWKVAEAYVNDYSSVDYDVTTNYGTRYISSHTSADSFGPAEEMLYVLESDVQGAMGTDFIPFSNKDDADSFRSEYGGDIVGFDDITPGMLGR